MIDLTIIEIINPIIPNIRIPTAETFATISNSCLVGFFKTFQTLRHFNANDFVLDHNSFAIFVIELMGF